MNFKYLAAFAAATAVAFAGAAAQAATTVYNSTPADGWFYGNGNDYAPANTAVLTTDEGDQLYLRAHIRTVVAPASTGDTYSFATGPATIINFDWGFDTPSLAGVMALITISKYGVGSFSYNPFVFTPDNEQENGSTQNSYRLNWTPPGFFTPNVDSSYKVTLAVNGLSGGDQALDIRVKVGAGATVVPEPATWAMMIMGFGAAGAVLRRRRTMVLA